MQAINEVICWICGKPVLLHDCKSDDHGRPVHENCYVATVLTEKRATFAPERQK
jgi:hypothetical protein